jgi:hypothetical protein
VTASSQDVLAFKARLPEFSIAADADVAANLDEADMWLDADMWEPADYPWARLFLAAHNLKLAMIYDMTSGGASFTSGVVGMYAKSVSFGERRVQFGERKSVSGQKGGAPAPGEDLFDDTIYGQKYLRLRSRNIIGVHTV